MKRQDTQNAFAIICSAAFIVILILKPELCTKGAAEGLLLAGSNNSLAFSLYRLRAFYNEIGRS